jgi:Tfp pilus assembly protein PilV
MSLLEALVSLVVLSLTVVSFLGTFQQSARAVRDADSWLHATQLAESAMESYKARLPVAPNADAYRTTVTERPRADGLVDTEVVVLLPDGRRFVLQRVSEP